MEYFAYKSKCKKILEIGCGTGKHTFEMTKRNYNVIDFDFSESQLKKPKEKALANNLQIEFQKQDAKKLTFLNEFPEYVPAYFFW